VGCRVVGTDGHDIGTVRAVVPSPAHDLLLVEHGGGEALVPFVRDIVPEVDVAGRRVVVDAPSGLLEP
jgi:16S rRNA processing protein RimM